MFGYSLSMPAKKTAKTTKTAKKKADSIEPVHTQEFELRAPVDDEEIIKVRTDAVKTDKKILVEAVFARERVITESSDLARDLYGQSRFGKILEDGTVQLSLHEALYLMEKKKLVLKDYRKRILDKHEFLNKTKRIEPQFWIRYCVFKDMRNRGYIIKTALKFGADFRVYDRGVKPGEDHARWVVYPVHEGSTLTWYEFAAKNRVAHSTKKRLLIGVVDDEGDVSYWEIKWMRP